MSPATSAPLHVAQNITLPVLPQNLTYLLAALGDGDIEIKALAAIVERFPGIAGRLLALANSAWAAPARPVSYLAGAISLLGMRVVRSASIALAVARPFDPHRCPGFDAMRYWSSAFLVAEGMALLSPHVGAGRDGETYRSAGLLHNLGLLLLADIDPLRTDLSFKAVAANQEIDLISVQRATLGTDYCDIGGQLGTAWRLPAELTVVMRHHREPDYRGAHWHLAACCGVAVAMSTALWRGMAQMADMEGTHGLDIPQSAIDTVFGQMKARREYTRDLAQALFSG